MFSAFQIERLTVVDRLRKQYVLVLLAYLLLNTLSVLLVSSQNIGEGGLETDLPLSIISLTILYSVVGFFLVNRNIALSIFTNVSVLMITSQAFIVTDNETLFITVIFALVSAALLSNFVIYSLVNFLMVIRAGIYLDEFVGGFESFLQTDNLTSNPIFGEFIFLFVSVLTPFIIAGATRYFVRNLRAVTIQSQRTSELLEASSSIGQIMARYLEPDELMNQSVNIIRERFGFYHVQIFMVDDEREFAVLRASTGETGQQLIALGHQLGLNSTSIIGRVMQTGEPAIARDTDKSADHIYNELLPNTRAELAVPIYEGNMIVGALDVQSVRVEAFTAVEIQALTVMATQLSTALRNARLFEQQEQNIRDNKRLFLESEGNLREIQRLNRQLTRQAWEDYLISERRITGVTLSSDAFVPVAQWTKNMTDASQRRRAIIDDSQTQEQTITVPIELRNEVIGAIEVSIASESTSDDVIEILQAVAGRLALSIDNARLFEETQETSAQEQRISDIVAEFQSANSIDDLLQLTLMGLSETIGAESSMIRLGFLDSLLDSDDSKETNKNNGLNSNGQTHA